MTRFTITEFSVASVSGNAVNGAFIVTTTVVGSDAVAFSTVGQKIEFCPGPSGFLGFSVPSLRKALKLSATICASTGCSRMEHATRWERERPREQIVGDRPRVEERRLVGSVRVAHQRELVQRDERRVVPGR